jgi:hypothetical protein
VVSGGDTIGSGNNNTNVENQENPVATQQYKDNFKASIFFLICI